METKKAIKSKIIWINLLPLALEILHLFDVNTLTAIGVPQHLQVKVIAFIALSTSVLTIIFRFGTTKAIKAVVLVASLGLLTGCKFGHALRQHNSVQVVKQPSHPEDTISVVWRFWGAKDLVNEFVPTNTKVGDFLKQSTRHCNIEVIEFPANLNDTVAVQLTCDSSLSTFKGWLPKNKNAGASQP